MNASILVIGAYGATGSRIATNLVKFTDADLILGGRKEPELEEIRESLHARQPQRNITTRVVDVTSFESLIDAMSGIDLVVIATTTPEQIDLVAQAALSCRCDMMDIFYRGDIYGKLAHYSYEIETHGLTFMTQGGYHPGMIAPLIRLGGEDYDSYHTANVAMVMNESFGSSSSGVELLYEVGHSKPLILDNGKWRTGSYRDMIKVPFSKDFGTRMCYPLNMPEIHDLDKELGISDMGCYVAGLNWFVDYFVFPLFVVLRVFSEPWALRICSHLMYLGVNSLLKGKTGTEIVVQSTGLRDGVPVSSTLSGYYPDAYDLTAMAVVATVKQYLADLTPEKGLHITGNVIDHKKYFADLAEMGFSLTREDHMVPEQGSYSLPDVSVE